MNIQRVGEAVQVHSAANQNVGSERIGFELRISQLAWRMLKKDLKFKPYSLKLLHKLNEGDFVGLNFQNSFLNITRLIPHGKTTFFEVMKRSSAWLKWSTATIVFIGLTKSPICRLKQTIWAHR